MNDLEVIVSASGVPVELVLDGVRWVVGIEPIRWFERVSWWETKTRMSTRGDGSRIEVEVWQLQAYPAAGDPTDLMTYEIVRDEGKWSVRSSG
jgi:hypothetical protein